MKNLLYVLLLALCFANIRPAVAENWVEGRDHWGPFYINTDNIIKSGNGLSYYTVRWPTSNGYEYFYSAVNCTDKIFYYKDEATGEYKLDDADVNDMEVYIKFVCP